MMDELTHEVGHLFGKQEMFKPKRKPEKKMAAAASQDE